MSGFFSKHEFFDDTDSYKQNANSKRSLYCNVQSESTETALGRRS